MARVLVVDDEPASVKLLLAKLRSQGYEARGEPSAEAGLASFLGRF